ncbi:MAG: polyphosphate kinase 1 [Coriobacteriia bacterium]|nr:polyphosphate kinase 1 [Coriobacteriia bacterium]
MSSSSFTYLQNRELSWLQFNKRVLDEACDDAVPLYERLKFISIFTSNLDEFFMVRVGSLTDLALVAPDTKDNKSQMTPQQQLEVVYDAVRPLIRQRDAVYDLVMGSLAEKGISEKRYEDLDQDEREHVDDLFESTIFPFLSPIVVDPRHPFPHLENKKLYVTTLLCDSEICRLGIVGIPSQVPAFLALPGGTGFIRTEQVVLAKTDRMFSTLEMVDRCIMAVTRNADLTEDEEKFDDDALDYRNYMSQLLKKRNRLNPVRVEMQGSPCADLQAMILERLELSPAQAYVCDAPLVLDSAYAFEGRIPAELRSEVCYGAFSPRRSDVFEAGRSITEQVKESDKMLFFPYDSIDPFLALLRESAHDPAVVSIKITLYRLASNSRIASILCDAAENGKEVTVLVELRARFDEQNNIGWSERLEEAGCSIVYGPDSYKCHSKVCLITRLEDGRAVQITQVGTGNYNEKTSRFYTDLSLMTADPRIGRDAVAFFQNMLVGNLRGDYRNLLVAPSNMHQTLCGLIDRETKKGPAGRIDVKCNSLTERAVIDALVRASRAGVRIRMNIRGICCLRPGIPQVTDNIQVRSVVGRFLEHSRIYAFGEGDDAVMYVGSADLMTRNLRRRVEVLVPVLDAGIRASLRDYLDLIFADTQKARLLQPDGNYVPVVDGGGDFSVQAWCMEHPLQRAAEPAAGAAAAGGGSAAGSPAAASSASGPGLSPASKATARGAGAGVGGFFRRLFGRRSA